MKKLILLLSIFAFTLVEAQTVTPRYSSDKNQDNTGRNLNYVTYTVTPSSTLVTLSPNGWQSVVIVPTSSIVPTFTANVSRSYLGDQVTMFVAANSTSRLATFSTNIIAPTSTVAIASNKKAVFKMVFDGAKFVLLNSVVEP